MSPKASLWNSPAKLVLGAKALDVSARRPGALCLGADQTLLLGDELFHKSPTMDSAAQNIKRLVGRTPQSRFRPLHCAPTARFCLRTIERAAMTMRSLDESAISPYIWRSRVRRSFRASAAYQVEGIGIHLFEKIGRRSFRHSGPALVASAAMAARPGLSRAMSALAPRACVTGWPVAHSPFAADPFLLAEKPGDRRLLRARRRASGRISWIRGADSAATGLVGANVTVPHKEAAFAACDGLTDAAAGLGAVKPRSGREDGPALRGQYRCRRLCRNLDDQAPGWAEQNACRAGAWRRRRCARDRSRARGGRRRADHYRQFARPTRAERLAIQFGARTSAGAWSALPELLRRVDLVVNTSSLGMVGQPPLAIDLRPLAEHTRSVADIV